MAIFIKNGKTSKIMPWLMSCPLGFLSSWFLAYWMAVCLFCSIYPCLPDTKHFAICQTNWHKHIGHPDGMSPYQDLRDIVVFYCLSSHSYNKKSQWQQVLVSPPPWPTEPQHVDKRKQLDAICSHTALWWARKSRTDLQYHQSNMILVYFLWNTLYELEHIFYTKQICIYSSSSCGKI